MKTQIESRVKCCCICGASGKRTATATPAQVHGHSAGYAQIIRYSQYTVSTKPRVLICILCFKGMMGMKMVEPDLSTAFRASTTIDSSSHGRHRCRGHLSLQGQRNRAAHPTVSNKSWRAGLRQLVNHNPSGCSVGVRVQTRRPFGSVIRESCVVGRPRRPAATPEASTRDVQLECMSVFLSWSVIHGPLH